jgi:asparagine synthase (glutamine-hydrolysing)
MCGVAGYINLNGKDASIEVIKLMTDAISHRGMDGEGQWVNGAVGIGHRRLAIIDLHPRGKQPMLSEDGRFAVSFNGEIYNHLEIKKELQHLGCKFVTNTDTEVVLHAISVWGIESINRFNGMFAFAFWDKVRKIFHLARDRYGIKPIYYAHQKNVFFFGSEQKAILANPEYEKSFDKEALLEYFTFQNIFTNATLQKNIKILLPGNYLTINLNSGEPKIKSTQYWDYCFHDSSNKISKKEYLEELDFLFRRAVKRQLISDVEVGAYLSGGMDSGSITAIATDLLPGMKTFTCGFDLSSASGLELSFDERATAEALSARFGTEQYEMVLKAGDMERCMPSLAWHLEEPRVGQSYPNFYAAKLASRFVKVVLSGSGGDELFGGYPWRYYRGNQEIQNFDEYINHHYDYWQRLLDSENLQKMFSPIWGEIKSVDTKEIFKNVFTNHSNELKNPNDYINHSLYFEAKTFLHGLFVVEDKLSMAYSLESRVPFMDNDLVDFAMKCPVNLKIRNPLQMLRIDENHIGDKQKSYFNKTNDGKQILREVMSKYIPKSITSGVKQGFSSPDASWFKGKSIEFLNRKLGNEQALIYEFMNRKTIKALIDDHTSGKSNKRLLIWSLLNFEEYLTKFN